MICVLIIVSIFEALAQPDVKSTPVPTKTALILNAGSGPVTIIARNKKKHQLVDWDHMTRGKDYAANSLLVILKKEISVTEKNRIVKKMSSIGNVKVHNYFQGGVIVYEITIKNGMSEKETANLLNKDVAVETVGQNSLIRLIRSPLNSEQKK